MALDSVRRDSVARWRADHDALLDEIERLALSAPGAGGVANPRYFAEMFAATLSVNPHYERIVLEEIRNAVERIVLRQGGEVSQ